MKKSINVCIISRIRDWLSHTDGHPINIPKAIQLARDCDHPDAIWLFHMCSDFIDRVQNDDLCDDFLKRMKRYYPDPRAICFAFTVQASSKGTTQVDRRSLRQAIPHPHAYILLIRYSLCDNNERQSWVRHLVDIGERDGYQLAAHLGDNNIPGHTMLDLYRKAANLGHINSMYTLANHHALAPYEQAYWFCQKIKHFPDPSSICCVAGIMSDRWKIIKKGNPDEDPKIESELKSAKQILLMCANCFRNHVENDRIHGHQLCGCNDLDHKRENIKTCERVRLMIDVCDDWINDTRKLIDTASLIMKHKFGVVKDIRLMICKMVWSDF